MLNADSKNRLRILSELGQTQSLASGEHSFVLHELNKKNCNSSGADKTFNHSSGKSFGNNSLASVLVLGLGAEPSYVLNFLASALPNLQLEALQIFYIESEDFLEQVNDEYLQAIPASFQQVKASDILDVLKLKPYLVQHTQTTNLFPSFWGALLATINCFAFSEQTQQKARAAEGRGQKSVLLLGTENSLLHLELLNAFKLNDYKVICVDNIIDSKALMQLIHKERPCLFFSLNGAGFGTFGENYYLLKELGVLCATWFVDNPWHNLSGLKAPFWKDLYIFCTDASFIKPLQEAGAKQAHHLPLAVDPTIFNNSSAPKLELAMPMLFVGRSVFPHKNSFFAGFKIEAELEQKAQAALLNNSFTLEARPDFHWWAKQLAISSFWPKKDMRKAGLGAANSSAFWRALCIKEALPCKPVIYGDFGWHDFLPKDVSVRTPVDYYNDLPTLYNNAVITLNATTFLLPEGLNQRHFDVWAAGGFLLTDANKGLDIFPAELTEPMTFKNPQKIPEIVSNLLNKPKLFKELKKAWQNLILKEHCYIHRVQKILELVAGEAK